jgi:hypothetical protein
MRLQFSITLPALLAGLTVGAAHLAVPVREIRVPVDTVVWDACFRLDSMSRRELRPAQPEVCGTVRLPASILTAPSGHFAVGTHTIAFEKLSVQEVGPAPGRAFARRDGTDTLRLSLNSEDGYSDGDSSVVYGTNDAGDFYADLDGDGRDVVGSWGQSCWCLSARGTARFRRN